MDDYGDQVFLAMTRKAETLGLPIEFIAAIWTVTMLLFLFIKSPFVLAVGLVLHFSCMAAYAADPYFLMIWLVRQRLPASPNTAYWGARSYDPA